MAIRLIRTDEDPILRKKARVVTDITERIHVLLDDMIETMEDADGVGLAASQVGVLKRVIITKVDEAIIEYINPEIVKEEGEQCGIEGCLSIPEQSGRVIRPEKLLVKAMDRHGVVFEMEAEGLLARAICHEIDHLNGVLFTDLMLPDDDDDDDDEDVNDLSEARN